MIPYDVLDLPRTLILTLLTELFVLIEWLETKLAKMISEAVLRHFLKIETVYVLEEEAIIVGEFKIRTELRKCCFFVMKN